MSDKPNEQLMNFGDLVNSKIEQQYLDKLREILREVCIKTSISFGVADLIEQDETSSSKPNKAAISRFGMVGVAGNTITGSLVLELNNEYIDMTIPEVYNMSKEGKQAWVGEIINNVAGVFVARLKERGIDAMRSLNTVCEGESIKVLEATGRNKIYTIYFGNSKNQKICLRYAFSLTPEFTLSEKQDNSEIAGDSGDLIEF